MVLSRLIAAYRKEQGMTLDQLAAESGVSRLALWRLEQGKFLQMKQFVALMRWILGEK